MIGYDGKKHNDEEAVNRFRRLGNGLWLRKQVNVFYHLILKLTLLNLARCQLLLK